MYGAIETNSLTDHDAYFTALSESVEMTLKGLSAAKGKVTRVRMLTEKRGPVRYADISYVHGVLPDGRMVRVILTGESIGVPFGAMKGNLIRWAIEEGVYGKGIGLLDNWSVMY